MSGGLELPGGLGHLLGRVLGGGRGGGQGQLVNVVLGMLARSGGSGGLAGLLSRLRDGGLADQARSWVDTGRNQPVSGKEITDALGEDEMVRLAGRAGLTKEETAAALAAALPGVVDAFTPGGEVPAPEAIDAMIDPDEAARERPPAPGSDDASAGTAPGGTTPGESAADEAAPKKPAPDEAASKKPASDEAAPRKPAPEDEGGPVKPEREA